MAPARHKNIAQMKIPKVLLASVVLVCSQVHVGAAAPVILWVFGALGAANSYISSYTGVARLYLAYQTFTGDYEEQKWKVGCTLYTDEYSLTYRGVTSWRIRTHWLGSNGADLFRTEYSDAPTDAIPFLHYTEDRWYECEYSVPPEYSPGLNVLISSPGLKCGYEVVKYPSMLQNTAPNPHKATITYTLNQLSTSCDPIIPNTFDLEYVWDFHRNELTSLNYPVNNTEILGISVVPRPLP